MKRFIDYSLGALLGVVFATIVFAALWIESKQPIVTKTSIGGVIEVVKVTEWDGTSVPVNKWGDVLAGRYTEEFTVPVEYFATDDAEEKEAEPTIPPFSEFVSYE